MGRKESNQTNKPTKIYRLFTSGSQQPPRYGHRVYLGDNVKDAKGHLINLRPDVLGRLPDTESQGLLNKVMLGLLYKHILNKYPMIHAKTE